MQNIVNIAIKYGGICLRKENKNFEIGQPKRKLEILNRTKRVLIKKIFCTACVWYK